MGEEMVGKEGRRAVVGEEGEGSEREASAGAAACRLGELVRGQGDEEAESFDIGNLLPFFQALAVVKKIASDVRIKSSPCRPLVVIV